MKKRLLVLLVILLFIGSGFTISNEAGKGGIVNKRVVAKIVYKSNENIVSALQPIVVITQPEDGAVVTDSHLVVLGYATDEAGMNYWEWTWKWEGGSYSNSSYFETAQYVEFRIDIYGLHEGWNEIIVCFKNIYGTIGCDSVNVTYMPPDTEPPDITIDYPENGTTFTEPNITVTGIATDNVGIVSFGYTHEWEGGGTGSSWPLEEPVTYYPFEINITLHDGWNRIRVEAWDNASNYGYDEVTVYYNVDNTPPQSWKIIGNPKYKDGYFITKKTPISFDAKDDLSGIEAIYYEIWDEISQKWNGPYAYIPGYSKPFTLEGIEKGNLKYKIRFYAIDKAGNVEWPPHEQEHIVDNALPITMPLPFTDYVIVFLGKTPYIYISPNTLIKLSSMDECCQKVLDITFYFDEIVHRYVKKNEEIEESGLPIKVEIWTENGGPFSGIIYSTWQEHILKINIPERLSSCQLKIRFYTKNFTNPKKPLNLFICEWKISSKTLKEIKGKKYALYLINDKKTHLIWGPFKIISYNVTNCQTEGSGVKCIQYRIFGETWVNYTAPFSIIEDGTYKIEYRSIDNLNHTEETKQMNITIDGIPPEKPRLLSPAPNETVNATPIFEWTNVSDATGVIYTIEISRDETFSECILKDELFGATKYRIPLEHKLSPGKYFWRVLAKDILNNTQGWGETRSFIVMKNQPPKKPEKPFGPSVIKAGINYTYSSFTTDPENDKIYYNFSWGDGNYSGWVGPYESGEKCEISYCWHNKGSYQIRVKAMDEYGMESEWSDPLPIRVPYSFNAFIEHPRNGLFVFGKKLISLKQTIVIGSIKVKVSGEGISKIEFYVDGKLKHIDETVPFTWLWNEFALGRHEIKVVAHDYAGNTAIDEQKIWIFNI